LCENFGVKRKLIVEFAEEDSNYEIKGTEITELENQRVTYSFDRGSITASELINRISSKFRIHDLGVREPDIENTIRRIYEERLLE